MLIADSMSVQLRSGIFCSAILRRSSLADGRNLVPLGNAGRVSMPQAFFISSAAGESW